MLREMTARQLTEWKAFYSLEPWGVLVLDSLLAHFKVLFVNSNLKKGKKPYKAEKFRLYGEKKKDVDDLFEIEEEE